MKKFIHIFAVAASCGLAAGTSATPFVNSPPSISGVSDQIILENSSLNFSFTVGDVDPGHLEGLLVTATSLTPAIFPSVLLSG